MTVVRYLSRKFESVSELRVRLIESMYPAQHPSTLDILKASSSQRFGWLHQKTSRNYMIYILKVVKSSSGVMVQVKVDRGAISKRSQQESEVESTYKELKEKHQESWDTPRLKLWARCIVSGIHDDYDNPPDSPAISCAAPKRHARNH